MQRLEKRYQKLCRFVKDARKCISKEKPKKTRSEDGRKLIKKESGKINNYENEDAFNKIGLLKGRLDAAYIVMNKQKSQISDYKEEIESKNQQITKLKQRLMKSEAVKASKESLAQNQAELFNNTESKNKDITEKYNTVKKEADHLKQSLNLVQVQMIALRNQYNKAIEENDACKLKLIETKTKAEQEVLQLKKEMSDEKDKSREWEIKFKKLHKHFIKNTEIASERISLANKKLKEFFNTIEIFLDFAHELNNSFAVFEAQKIASSILNIPTNEVLKLTEAKNKPQLQEWIQQVKCLIEKEIFSEELALFLHNISKNEANKQRCGEENEKKQLIII